MKPDRWLALTEEQRITLSLSMHIRNKLEDFHVAHISDRHMPELNSTIRYAVHEFLTDMTPEVLGWLAMMVPDYWEVSGADPRPVFAGEFLWEGKPFPKQADEEDDAHPAN